jgi:CubicO group peptidase (beta-lactamase class C family)
VLGEFISRKLGTKYKDPLDYLTKRILDPLGIHYTEWLRDSAGNPHVPNGAHLTARDWWRFGQFLLHSAENGKAGRSFLVTCSWNPSGRPGSIPATGSPSG